MSAKNVAELIDLEAMQTLMIAFFQATGFPQALIDTDNQVLVHAGWQKACTDYHRAHPASCLRCQESDRYIYHHLNEGRFVGYPCLNGLNGYATPVMVNGEHVANIFTGQILHAPPDMAFFRRQAQEFGYDEAAYLQAIGEVPVVPKERVQAIMIFLSTLATFVGSQGVVRSQLQEEIGVRKQAEAAMKQRSEELQAAYKELEAFSYSVSHDLRTPLRAIDGFSRMLLEDYEDKLDDEGKRMLNVVRDNTQRMNRLIEDILAFSRTGTTTMRMAPADMAALARSTLEELQPAMDGRHVQIEIGALPMAEGDSAMLRQVFVNLLSNAIKFTRPSEQAIIEISGRTEGGEHIYRVKDNGVGFDMQYGAKLFGVFQRLHSVEEFEGTGIGLAIVKRIIVRHGGRVWAEGAVGQGASFYFSLPEKTT